jgi:hypothetical protein
MMKTIYPYRHHGQWVFDDPDVGLEKEPLIAGADVLLDRAVAEARHRKPTPEGRVCVRFSRRPFAGAERLVWTRGEGHGGNYYYSARHKLEAWLCPQLYKYFRTAPRRLYVVVSIGEE